MSPTQLVYMNPCLEGDRPTLVGVKQPEGRAVGYTRQW